MVGVLEDVADAEEVVVAGAEEASGAEEVSDVEVVADAGEVGVFKDLADTEEVAGAEEDGVLGDLVEDQDGVVVKFWESCDSGKRDMLELQQLHKFTLTATNSLRFENKQVYNITILLLYRASIILK